MKITFKKITLENFRSFRGRHEFYIQDSGLYLVHGNNLVDEKLESNGVGKSSLFEALLYVFEGKTSRGLKRTDVTTWGETKCNVALDFLIDDVFYRVTRTSGNPMQLHIKKEEEKCSIPQENIYDFLGIPKHFLYCIIFSQFQPGFFELKPQERLNYFCELFDFDAWDTYKEKAKIHSKELDSIIHVAVSKLELSEGWFQTLLEQECGLLEQQKSWKQLQDVECKNRQEAVKALKREKQALNGQSNILHNNVAPIKRQIQDTQCEVSSLEDRIELEDTAVAEAFADVQQIQGKLDTELGYLSKLKALQYDKICSHCGSAVSVSVVKKQIEEQQKRIKGLLTAKENSNSIVLKRQQQQKKTEVLLNKREEAQVKLANDLQQLFMEQNTLTRKIGHLNELLQEKQSVILKESPYKELLQKTKKVLKVLPRYTEHQQAVIEELRQEKDVADFWAITGFTAIKLILVRSVADSYEVLVNSYLHKLGLPDWNIEISMEKELKSGAFKSQFEVLVNNGCNTNVTTPLSAWSGGEVQRLKLAGNFALSDLIAFWSNIQCNLLVIDECTEHLSDAGISDLLAILGEKSTSQTVYNITHGQSELKGAYNGVIEIVKGLEGTQIEVL